MSECTLTAFYGGTFDPIHYGHLRSVVALMRLINLKRVTFIPNKVPPHRPSPIASVQQRLTMIRLAINELPNQLFSLDDREIQRSILPSYTIDTFKILRREYGPNTPLAFIIGLDSLLTLPQWYHGLELLSLCHLLVCSRSNCNDKSDNKHKDSSWITHRVICNPQALYKQPKGFIYFASTPKITISSTDIRSRYQEGLTCNGLLPPSVQDYIEVQGLYR